MRPNAGLAGAGLFLIVFWAENTGRAEDWVGEPEDIDARAGDALVRVSTRTSFWVASFARPEVCVPSRRPGLPVEEGDVANVLGGGCGSSDSEEVALGLGGEVSFRAAAPLYLSVGLDVLYTATSGGGRESQLLAALPLSLTLTWYSWTVRPIAQASLTPVFYLTDDTRDYTLGGTAGAALRLLSFGDLSLTLGYHSGDTVQAWQLQLGLHPIF